MHIYLSRPCGRIALYTFVDVSEERIAYIFISGKCSTTTKLLRLQWFSAKTVKSSTFRDTKPCVPDDLNWLFEWTYYLHFKSPNIIHTIYLVIDLCGIFYRVPEDICNRYRRDSKLKDIVLRSYTTNLVDDLDVTSFLVKLNLRLWSWRQYEVTASLTTVKVLPNILCVGGSADPSALRDDSYK